MATMRAVRMHEYGGLDVLREETIPHPAFGGDDVLVRVHAAGVNPLDWKVRYGDVQMWFNHTLPLIPGWDVSGVVEAVGPAVTTLRPGDEVYGRADINRDGAYAEYAAARAADLALKPRTLGHVEAAAVPQAALAAWLSLFDTASLSAGQTVLVHGAAGGVGTFAVQLAKWRGARVFGTASARNQGFLRELGAEPIDYATTAFEDVARDVDVVLDAVGGATLNRSWSVLKPGGVLVSLVEPPSESAAAEHGVRSAFVAAYPRADILAELAGLIDAGHIRPVVSHTLPLSEARQAHAMSESLHVRGKIVLQIVE